MKMIRISLVSRFKLVLFLFISFFALIFGVLTVYAWFFKVEEKSIVIESSEFTITLKISFDDLEISKESEYYDDINKVLIVAGRKLSEGEEIPDNYIDKLEVSFQITPHIPARLRVKVQDEWLVTRNYYSGRVTQRVIAHETDAIHPTSPNYPFIIPNLVDYTYDPISGYLYYNAILEKDITLTIPFIEKGKPYQVRNTETFTEDCTVFLDLSIDVVQANRYQELWGVDF